MKLVLKLHIFALLILIVNWLFSTYLDTSLYNSCVFAVKIFMIISGLALFFQNIRPVTTSVLYFVAYPILSVFFLIGLVFKGIFGALIMSVILLTIVPNNEIYEKDGVMISTIFQGFMGRCCKYQISERYFWAFENSYTTIDVGGEIDANTIQIESDANQIDLSFKVYGDTSRTVIQIQK